MGLDMLLPILGTLEGLAAEVTLVRLQGDVDTNVRGNMVTLNSGDSTLPPLAS